jgi:hypothetical protein
MYSPYGLHSMSRQYREDALRDARARHLEGWLRANRRTRSGKSRASLSSGVMSMLHAVMPSR